MCEVNATFYHNDWWPCKNSTHYSCQVQAEKITQRKIAKFTGPHKINRTNDNVMGVRFDDCEMDFIPTGVVKAFKNVKIFLIFNSKIKKLTKEDFAEYSQITQLWFSSCEIEYLPGNLLDLLPKLEILSIQSSKVKYIDANIFDNHPNLKVVKFNSNINIDCWYDSVSGNTGTGKVSFEELKEKVRKNAQPPNGYQTYFKLPTRLSADLKSFLNEAGTKDVKISIGDESVEVHSIVLQLRSRKLREMLKNGEELKFEGFCMKNLKSAIEFCYSEEITGDYDVTELIKIANELQIPCVKSFAMENLENVEVTEDNAISIMKISKEIGNKKLQENAFSEIRKSLPEKDVKDEWFDDVSKLERIMEAKQRMQKQIEMAKELMEEQIKLAQNKFNLLFI